MRLWESWKGGLGRGVLVGGMVLAGSSGGWGHIGDRVYPIFELSDAMLASVDLRDGSLQEWKELGGASLGAADFYALPDVGRGPVCDPADMDYEIWLGWNGASGRLYLAMERRDDVYVNEYAGGNLNDLWRHDASVTFIVDGDHSGGDFTGSADPAWSAEEQTLHNNRTAQLYQAIAEAPDGRHIGYAGAGIEWVAVPPFADGAGRLLDGSPSRTVLEFYVTPFDDLVWNSPEHSAPSPLYAGKIVGFQIEVADFDSGPSEYRAYHMLSPNPAWRYADQFVDGRLVSGPPTSVENRTWARIKASFGAR